MTRPAWTLRVDAPASGAANMALDQTLLDHANTAGSTTLRLYAWSPHCLSLGRNEPALKRYDRERIEQRGLDTVRRPTGGRAVWHGRELTYAVTAPLDEFGGLTGAYSDIHHLLADALRTLGAEPVLAPIPDRIVGLTAGACFATSAGGELMVSGYKIVGSAQLTQGRAFLQHGSVLLEDGQSLVSELTSIPGRAHHGSAANLSGLLERTISFGEARDAVIGAARRAWGSPMTTSETLQLDASPVHLTRFSDPGWTWRR
jgi:lipoate-protein ligase A